MNAKCKFIHLVVTEQFKLGRKRQVMADELAGAHSIGKDLHSALFSMDISSFSEERIATVQAEAAKIKTMMDYYASASPADLWRRDLDALEAKLPDFWKERVDADDGDDG